jgi:hypothetical protein
MPLIVPRPSTRRHALLIGVSRYASEEWNRISAGVEQEIAQAERLFQQKLEYDTHDIIRETDQANIGKRVVDWARKHASHENNVCVLYYTGHGFVAPSSGTLYLITSDVEPGYESNAPAATKVVDWLGKIKANILVIIDTCHSSAMTVDAQVLQDRGKSQSSGTRQIQFIASARSIEVARPGWFMEALSLALDEVASQNDEFASMEKVLANINRRLAKKSLDIRLENLSKKLAAESYSDSEIVHALEDERRKHEQDPESMQRARFSGAIEELSQFFPNQGRLEFTPRLDSQQAMRVLHRIQRCVPQPLGPQSTRGAIGNPTRLVLLGPSQGSGTTEKLDHRGARGTHSRRVWYGGFWKVGAARSLRHAG